MPDRVGLETLKGLAYIGGLARLAGESAYITFVAPFQGQRLRPQRAFHQAMAVGVEAIPIVSLISFFVGLIMALQSAYELKRLRRHAIRGQRRRHLDRPRTGPADYRHHRDRPVRFRLRRGNRHHESDAKKSTRSKPWRFDPVGFLVAPKFLAMLVMVPCLTIWADLHGHRGRMPFRRGGANFTFLSYLQATLDALLLRDIYHRPGEERSCLRVVITAVGCQEGFSTGAGAEEVGRSTTAAVVKSIFVVILVDLVFTALFYFTNRG